MSAAPLSDAELADRVRLAAAALNAAIDAAHAAGISVVFSVISSTRDAAPEDRIGRVRIERPRDLVTGREAVPL